jgi:hypothetical protein
MAFRVISPLNNLVIDASDPMAASKFLVKQHFINQANGLSRFIIADNANNRYGGHVEFTNNGRKAKIHVFPTNAMHINNLGYPLGINSLGMPVGMNGVAVGMPGVMPAVGMPGVMPIGVGMPGVMPIGVGLGMAGVVTPEGQLLDVKQNVPAKGPTFMGPARILSPVSPGGPGALRAVPGLIYSSDLYGTRAVLKPVLVVNHSEPATANESTNTPTTQPQPAQPVAGVTTQTTVV